MYISSSHFAVQQKLTHQCTSTILQFKKKAKNKGSNKKVILVLLL